MDDLEAILCFVAIQTTGWPVCRLKPLVDALNAAVEAGGTDWHPDGYISAKQPVFDVLVEYGMISSDISTEGAK